MIGSNVQNGIGPKMVWYHQQPIFCARELEAGYKTKVTDDDYNYSDVTQKSHQ